MVLTTHTHLSAEVMKGYTSTHPLGLHGLLWEHLYLYLLYALIQTHGLPDFFVSHTHIYIANEKSVERVPYVYGYLASSTYADQNQHNSLFVERHT